MPAKVKAIQTYPKLVDVKGLERFIGMINFYHSFIQHDAHALQPLYQAHTGGKTRPKSLEWSDAMDKGFVDTKEALTNATLLHHPVQGALTALTTDASDTAIGTSEQRSSSQKAYGELFFYHQYFGPQKTQ